MRKAELVNTISDRTGIPKVDVLVSLETFFNEVKDSLANGENVYIRGFGSFVIKKRAIKMIMSINTGKPHHHHIPRKIAEARKASLIAIPSVGIREGPKPKASKLAAAKIANDTFRVKLEAR